MNLVGRRFQIQKEGQLNIKFIIIICNSEKIDNNLENIN